MSRPATKAERGVAALPPAGRDRWALWNLRALRPGATAADLAALRARRFATAALQERVLERGEGDVPALFADALRVYGEHPELRRGLVFTAHVGPYTLVPGLALLAGVSPLVLLDAEAERTIRPRAEAQVRSLGLHGAIEWQAAEAPAAVRRILAALRAERPVVVYLDGNRGAGGMEATRDRGLDYELPGRMIRVRSGPGRLAVRGGRPVHGVVVRWRDDGRLDWSVERLDPWPADAAADDVARSLYDWLFGRIAETPEQWTYWGMLAASSACFAGEALAPEDAAVVASRRDVFRNALLRPDAVRLRLRAGVEVWEPGLLVDTRRDRFHDACGVTDAELAPLRERPRSLRELAEARGWRWVGRVVRRLVLLGLAELEADA